MAAVRRFSWACAIAPPPRPPPNLPQLRLLKPASFSTLLCEAFFAVLRDTDRHNHEVLEKLGQEVSIRELGVLDMLCLGPWSTSRLRPG